MNCTFCGCNMVPGTGILFVKKTGKIMNLCSKKCEKNSLKLGRIPRKVKWTKAARIEKKKGAK